MPLLASYSFVRFPTLTYPKIQQAKHPLAAFRTFVDA